MWLDTIIVIGFIVFIVWFVNKQTGVFSKILGFLNRHD